MGLERGGKPGNLFTDNLEGDREALAITHGGLEARSKGANGFSNLGDTRTNLCADNLTECFDRLHPPLECQEELGERRIYAGKDVSTEATERSLCVGECTGQGVTHFSCHGTSSLRHCLLEGLKVDLTVGGHLEDLFSSLTQFVRECLVDGDTSVGDLRQHIILSLTHGGNLVINRAHLFHTGAGGSCGVGYGLQDCFQTLTRLNTSRHSTGRSSRCRVQTERGTLHGSRRVVHNDLHAIRIISQTTQLCLRNVNRLETVKALAERGAKDRAQADTSKCFGDQPGDNGAELRAETSGCLCARAVTCGAHLSNNLGTCTLGRGDN